MPDWLERIVSSSHAFNSRDRLASAGDAARLISASLAHVQQPEKNLLPQELEPRVTDRRFPFKAAGVVGLLALSAITLIGSMMMQPDAYLKPLADIRIPCGTIST